MNPNLPVVRQWISGSVLLGLLGLAWALAPWRAPAPAGTSLTPDSALEERPHLESTHRETLAFFGSRPVRQAGRGLFETDYFKPAPKPPPPPKPTPPLTREAPALYRGFSEPASGLRLAYVEVDGSLRTLAVGDTVLGPWKVEKINDDSLVLLGGDLSEELAFRKRSTLTVPASAK